jgi:hypothetical protein
MIGSSALRLRLWYIYLARAEDTALRERNRSAAAGGQTAGQGLRDSALFVFLPGWRPGKR